MRNRLILLFLLMLALVTSCAEGPDMPMQSLSVDKDVIIAPSVGVTYTLKINTNTSWKLKCSSVDWIVPSMYESIGTHSISIAIEPNTGDERTAVILAESKDEAISREIRIVQSGAAADGYISISALRKMEKADEQVVLDAKDSKVKGFVVTDVDGGNWFSGSFAIEDSFSAPESGITVVVDGEFEAFRQGVEVAVDLDNARLGRTEDGFLAIIPAAVPSVTETTPLDEIQPVEVDFSGVSSGDYESMYVLMDGFQVVEDAIGGTLGQSPLFENEDAEYVRLMVGDNAVFSLEEYPEGVGTISGIAGHSGDTPALWPTAGKGIVLSEMRIGVKPGIRRLPYVFSLYCREQTNTTPKYVEYTKLAWNSSTTMMQGTIARELDATKGVSLDVSVYGADASKIYGPNFWAEAGAHDNINTSGFVSFECKTTPAAECGWYLNVPLQMEMPADFNFSFGLYLNNKYCLGNWAIAWSVNKSEWTEAGRIYIDKPKTGGCYYYYFTVPVHTAAPLAPDTMLYIKLVPVGSDGTDGYKNADGHGSSCYVGVHSALVLSEEVEGNTPVPTGAIYFEPFDKLTSGMDYFIGEKLAGLSNFSGNEFAKWSDDKKNGMEGLFVMERPGYAQIGYVNTVEAAGRGLYENNCGSLLTPAIGKGGDLNLSFKACTYRTPAIREKAATTTSDVGHPDITSVVVEIVGGGTINGNTSVVVSGLPVSSFKTFSLKITGATENTRIRFTSAPADDEFSRWFIDDILVTE